MAEIGLIASVVGVAGAALAASKALSDMIDQIRNAPEEIIAISKDTHSFHGIITNVQVAITDQFIVSRLQTEQQILRAVKQLEEPLKNCGIILTQMQSRIKRHLKQSDNGGFRVSSFDMRWIFQRKDVVDCRNRLETTKSTLDAALSSVVFLCHMKMMGSLRHGPDVLSVLALDLDAGSALREYAESIASRSPPPELDDDAGSALREYAESIASRSPPLDGTFESMAGKSEMSAQRISMLEQPSQEELRRLESDTSITADKFRAHSEVLNTDLKAINPTYTESLDLRSAIDARDIGKIELMLAENRDPNTSATDGWTALHVAAECGRIAIVQLLIERNADVNCKTLLGLTPLHIAAQHRSHVDIIKMLLNFKGINVNAITDTKETPLHEAAYEGDVWIVQTLLNAKDININATTTDAETPLHEAAYEGHVRIVQILLNAKDINVNAANVEGWTSLHIAASRGYVDIVKMLLNSKDININATSDTGWTPLHAAAYEGQESIVKLLLDNNADISTENKYHKTALLHAIMAHHEDTAMLLIQRGSPLIATRQFQRSSLYDACLENSPRLVKAIIKKAKSSGQLQTMLKIDYGGFRPLHVAAWQGSLKITSQLVEAGANINVRDRSMKTPLMFATWQGQLQVMDYLLAHGADRHAKCDRGWDYLRHLKTEHSDKYEEHY
ncbi:MAG: hypothetical protein Q9195_005504 [Heterodermia aff. obscurata]